MAETHVISPLVDKRARVAGAIAARRFQIMRLEMELTHLEAVTRKFKPGYDVEGILPKRSFTKNPAGVPKGAGGRDALSILREAGAPLTASEIAERVLTRRGKPRTDEARRMLTNTITSTLLRRKDGAVTFDAQTQPGRWSLTGH